MKRIFLLLILTCVTARVHAFPEMVRHGYANCASCHVSPAGGGMLNSYGRVLSAELLSTWSRDGEGDFLYGLAPSSDIVSFGADFRALQIHTESDRERRGRFVLMQSDIEAALSHSGFTAVGTVGYREAGARPSAILSRRHYLIYQASDSVSIRAGRFATAFGLMNAEHQVVTRAGLGWDQGSETYNAELAYAGEDLDLFVTGQFGSPFDGDNREQGAAVRLAGHFSSTLRAGLSYFYGDRKGSRRHLLGPFAALGITPRFFILAEIDVEKQISDRKDGARGYLRVDYEVLQGIHLYAAQEYSRTRWNDPRTTSQSHGLGVQFFPRPHFEFNLFFQKQQVQALSTRYADFVGLMGHIYL